MSLKKKTGILTALLLVMGVLSAETTLPQRLLEELRTEEELVRYFYGDLDLQYLPFGTLSDKVIQDLEGQQATIGVEALFLIDLPPKLASDPNKDLILFNLMNRASSLAGIEYYSASRERMRTLFVDAYRVDQVGSKNALPDQAYSSIPESETHIIFQEDLTFGKNYVETSYQYQDGRFLMQVHNLTTMRYYFFPLVRPRNLKMDLLILPQDKQLLFYGASSVDSASLFGIEKSKKDSFYNRIKAMHSWFDSLIQTEYSE